MTFPKTSLALLALLTLAACKKNDHEIIDKEVVRTSSIQKLNLLSEATQITPFWDRSRTVSAGAKGQLSIVPFDESQLYTTDKIHRRMLVLNDDRNSPMFVEVYPANKISEADLNRAISNFISFDKTASERMINDFEGTIFLYDKHKKRLRGLTYNKKYSKPGISVLSLNNDAAKVAPSEGEECWYLVLTTTYTQYFSDGSVYTWSESEIVGSYCTGNGLQTGGGISDECANSLTSLINSGYAVSEFQRATLVSEGPETRTKNYDWTFFRSGDQILPPNIWYFNSHEVGVHKKVNNVWNWQSLKHISISREGFVAGGTVEVTVNTATETVGIYWAMMTLNFNVKYSVVCKSFPLSSARDDEKSAAFHVNY